MSDTPVNDRMIWRLPEVDAQRMKILALLLADPNPIHFDAAAASRLGIADVPVNQGPSTVAMVYNLFDRTHPGKRVRKLNVRLLGNVLAGGEAVVAARPVDDGPGYDVEVLTNDDVPVLRGHAELAEEET